LDNSIAEAVKSIAYAAPRYDIKELNDVNKFYMKYIYTHVFNIYYKH